MRLATDSTSRSTVHSSQTSATTTDSQPVSPALPLAPSEIRRAMKLAYGAQAFGEIARLALFRGGVLPLFALLVGATNSHLGLLSGMPDGMIALTFIVSPLVARYGKRRWIVALLGLSSVAFLGLFLVYSIYTMWGSGAAIGALILFMFLQSSFQGVGVAAWWPLLNDIIPPDMTGLFFGRMRTIFELSGLLVLLVASAFLGKSPPIWKFMVVFVVGALGLFLRVYLLSRLPDPVGADPDLQVSVSRHVASLQKPMRDPAFRYYCFMTFAFSFLIFAPMPLYVPYLSISRAFPTSLTVVGVAGLSLGSVLSLIPWGRYADHHNVRSLFVKSLSPLAGLHVLLACVPLHEAAPFVAVALSALSLVGAGVGTAGFGIAYTSYAFHHTPRAHASTYMGLQQFSKGLGAFLGSLVGGTAADALSNWTWRLPAFSLDNYQTIFICCAFLLLAALWLVRGLRTGEST